MSAVLVINGGSSSIKYELVDDEGSIARGLIERIGEAVPGRVTHTVRGVSHCTEAPIADHPAAFALMVAAFLEADLPLDRAGIVAVGHRVVHGGAEFVAPTLIDDAVAERILALAVLAPLHNPGNYQAIVAARALLPNVPHVAVFDTAFHQSMPKAAYTYAIDREVAEAHGVRRYGFHGISHEVVSRRAAEHLGRPLDSLRQIVLHLGNGASACAVRDGRSVATTMGMTPLEGLVMGTRGGDVDPGALLHLLRAGMSVAELDHLLNHESGMLGLTGSNDLRDVLGRAAAGDSVAELALEVYAGRARRAVGAYLAELSGADTLVFTAGVGEGSAVLRARICRGLEWMGVELDAASNAALATGARIISAPHSRVTVLVVPTDEEGEIARQARAFIG